MHGTFRLYMGALHHTPTRLATRGSVTPASPLVFEELVVEEQLGWEFGSCNGLQARHPARRNGCGSRRAARVFESCCQELQQSLLEVWVLHVRSSTSTRCVGTASLHCNGTWSCRRVHQRIGGRHRGYTVKTSRKGLLILIGNEVVVPISWGQHLSLALKEKMKKANSCVKE